MPLTNSQIVEFHTNKKKAKKLVLMYSAIFIALLLMFLYSIGIGSNEIVIKGIVLSAALMLFIAYFLFKAITRLNSSAALVKLQPEGITSKVTPMSEAAGLIRWDDIQEINITKMGWDTLVTLYLVNADHYIPTIRKKLSGIALEGAIDEQGSLRIYLSAAELDVDAEELLNQIKNYPNS